MNFILHGKGTLGKPKRKNRSARLWSDPYQLWINKQEKYTQDECHKQLKTLCLKPKISIIIPTFNSNLKYLRAALDSVQNQFYQNFEICLYDDGSTSIKLKSWLSDWSHLDKNKINIQWGKVNQGIAAATNQAVAQATGQYITFLDHDDTLAPFALWEVVKAINRQPDVDIIYSDEDKIDKHGRRSNPFFKPDWNPDLLWSQMYTCHLTVYRKKILNKILPIPLEYSGSQDYHLIMRASELTRNIIHIPKILYHWRDCAGSTAGTRGKKQSAKPYAYIAAGKVLQAAAQRRQIAGIIIPDIQCGHYRLKRNILNHPLISIIIPFKDQLSITQKCWQSILKKTDYQNFEILLINNQSSTKFQDEINAWEKIDNRLKIYNYRLPFNYSAINNWAVTQTRGEHILLLNNDTEIITSEWLSALLEQSQRAKVGAVGALLLYPNNTIQHAGVIVGLGGAAAHSHAQLPIAEPGYLRRPYLIHNVSALTGACLMVKKSTYQQFNGLEEQHFGVAYNDVDFCLRLLEAGLLNVYTPYAKLYHHESLSRGYENTPEKQMRQTAEIEYLIKQHPWIFEQGDPNYNPNLTLEDGSFSIRI